MRSPVTTLDARQRLRSLRGLWPGIHIVTLSNRYVGLVRASDLAVADPDLTVGDVSDNGAPLLSPEEDLGRTALDELAKSGYRSSPS